MTTSALMMSDAAFKRLCDPRAARKARLEAKRAAAGLKPAKRQLTAVEIARMGGIKRAENLRKRAAELAEDNRADVQALADGTA